MRISTQWSAMVGISKPQQKPRVFETDKGFLLTSITDATPDDAFERFKTIMLRHANNFDKYESQSEVYRYEKLINRFAKQAGIVDS